MSRGKTTLLFNVTNLGIPFYSRKFIKGQDFTKIWKKECRKENFFRVGIQGHYS